MRDKSLKSNGVSRTLKKRMVSQYRISRVQRLQNLSSLNMIFFQCRKQAWAVAGPSFKKYILPECQWMVFRADSLMGDKLNTQPFHVKRGRYVLYTM